MIFLNQKSQVFVILFVNVVFREIDKVHAKKSFVNLLQNIVDVNEKRIGGMKRKHNMEDFIMTPNSLPDIHDFDEIIKDDSAAVSNQHAFLSLIDIRSHLNLPPLKRYRKKSKATNKIYIIIPFNSFNIKSHYRNVENYIKGKRNDYYGKVGSRNNDNGKKHNINHDKRNQDYNKVYNINTDNAKIYKQVDYNSKDNRNNEYYDKMGNRNDDYDLKDFINNYNENIDGEIYRRKSWRGSCNKSAARACKKACVSAYKNVCMIYKCSRRAKKAYRKECKRSCKAKFNTGRYSDSDWESE